MKRILLTLPVLAMLAATPALSEDSAAESCTPSALIEQTIELFQLHHAEEISSACEDSLGNSFVVTLYSTGEDLNDDGETDFSAYIEANYAQLP